MPLSSTNTQPGNIVKSADIIQFFNLFTGAMTDQAVSLKNQVTVGGNQGASTPAFTINGVAAQTADYLDITASGGAVGGIFKIPSSGVLTLGSGLTITSGGETIQAGGLTVTAGTVDFTGATVKANLANASASGVGNIALGAAGTWTDVLSISLAAGTWFVIANGEGTDTSGAAVIDTRIYDGTTVYAAGRVSTTGASQVAVVTVNAIITLGGTTTVKLQMKDETSGNGFSQYTVDGISGIRAIRIL